MKKIFTLGKIGENSVNEDAALLTDEVLAVSDGAGGGGLYAEKWSRYLLDKLPKTPLTSADDLDNWIDGIWQPFYDECEAAAKQQGGLTLQKFYDEGSFATLAAVWKVSDTQCKWLTYGDSVVFYYNKKNDVLEYSISGLMEFNNPPYLINFLDKIKPEGVKTGSFEISNDSVLIVASDALSHYILMMYMLTHCDLYAEELNRALSASTKNSNYIRAAQSLPKIDFYTDVVKKLFLSDYHLTKHLEKLYRDKLIALDDYSVAAIFV
jgi:hypothetical protein